MVVINSPHNPVGKVFSKDELQAIGDLCVKHNIIILSDEVYDRLYYVPFTRIATLSPEIAKLDAHGRFGRKELLCHRMESRPAHRTGASDQVCRRGSYQNLLQQRQSIAGGDRNSF